MEKVSIALLIILASIFCCVRTEEEYTIVGSRTIQHGSRYRVYVDTSKLERDDAVIMRLQGQKSTLRRVEPRDESFNYNGQNVYDLNLDESRLAKQYKLSILSYRNGMCAYDEIPIFPVHKECSVFIQMDKPLYKPRDAVQFRVVMIDEQTRPFKPNRLVVKVREAKGEIVRTFNVNPTEVKKGIYKNDFSLAEEPNLGIWNISVIVNERENEEIIKSFEVKEYVLPLLNINITSNSYLLHTDASLRLFISAKYSFGILAKGSASVTAKVYDQSKIVQHTLKKRIEIETIKAIDFHIIKELKIKPTDSDRTIDIVVDFTDELTGKKFTKIKNVTYRDKNTFYIRLYKKKTFIPGNHYEFYVSIKDYDGIPQTSKSYPVKMSCEQSVGHNVEKLIQPTFLDKGFAKFSWFVPKDVTNLNITVTYRDSTKNFVSLPGNETKIEDFEATITTKEPSLQEMITVQLKGVSNIGLVNYAVTGRLGLAEAGSHNCQQRTSCELTIPTNDDMLPEATVMVYFMNANGDIIYDTSRVHFKQFSSNHLNIKMPSRKNVLPGSKINLELDSLPNSLVALLGIDEALTYLRIGHDIDDVDVEKDLLLFGHSEFTFKHPRAKIVENSFVYHQDFRNLRKCSNKEKVMLNEAGVAVQEGSSIEPYYRVSKRSITEDAEEYPPEYSIIPETFEDEEDPDEPRVRRDFRDVFIFDTATIDRNGKGTVDIQLPDKITTWLITGFAMNDESGFALAEPTQITSIQQMFVKLFLPYSIKFGEILKVDATVFNFMKATNSLKVDVTMVAVDEDQQYFEFIEFDGCQPRIVHEDQMTKSVSVKQNSASTAFFHIRAMKSGEIKILVKAISSRAKDAIEQTLNVEHEGTPYYETENILLNLTDVNSVSSKFQYVPANESMPGSLKFYATVTSSVIPIFPPERTKAGNDFVNHLFIMPTGCQEQITYRFTYCVIAHSFLRARNILTPSLSSTLLSYITTGYQNILAFRNYDGSFNLWGSNLWMTAYISKLFGLARGAIHLNIDNRRGSLNYLRNLQGGNGGYERYNSISESYSLSNVKLLGVKMTAFVITAIMENSDLMGEYDDMIVKGLRYISENVDDLNDNYATAISAYAFALANKTEKAVDLLETLNNTAIYAGDNKYWGESGRTCTSNSICTEISAYVLLAYARMNKLLEAVSVENWLISQRNVHGTYANSFCTYLNVYALGEIGKLEKIERFEADVSLKTNFDEIHNFKIDAMDATPQPIVLLRTETRMLTLNATKTSGKGVCHASIEFYYTRREENVTKNFDLDVFVQSRQDKSATLRVCSKFNADTIIEKTTMTLMEVQAPSGYVFDKETNFAAQNLAQFQKRELKDLATKEILYFESFNSTEVCPTFNLIKINEIVGEKKSVAKIYEYYTLTSRATTFYNLDHNNCGTGK